MIRCGGKATHLSLFYITLSLDKLERVIRRENGAAGNTGFRMGLV